MPGENIQVTLPAGESGQVYAPASLAWRIENLQATAEGTLRAVRGPAPLIPDYGVGYPYGGRVHGVYHARLDGGARDVTLIRAGDKLYAQATYALPSGGLELLADGLSDDPHAKYPDVFVEVGGKIVWSNGIDAPRIYDGYTLKGLGYRAQPGAPSVLGPLDTGHPAFRNQGGYSHPGTIGIAGDFFDAASGSLLAAAYGYFVQFEDVFGDRSPLSPVGTAFIRQELTAGVYWIDYAADFPKTDSIFAVNIPLGDFTVSLDDLTRQLCLSGLPTGPPSTFKRILYRTTANDPTPRFLAEIPDNVSTIFPDNTPDANLGPVAQEVATTPRFHIACSYQGRLVVFAGNRLWWSEIGFPGTFLAESYRDIDADGAEASGLAAFNGKLYALTTRTVFRIELDAEGVRAEPVTGGSGTEAPQSVVTTDQGVLVWLGRRNWYGMGVDEAIQRIADAEAPLFKRLNPTALSRAVAVQHPVTREYLCAVPEAGALGNRLIMQWDGQNWRRTRLGLSIETLCVTRDWRSAVLAGGRNEASNQNNVWMLDREVRGYTLPAKTYVYRSAWIRLDPTGRLRFNVDTVYVGFVEASSGSATWQVWKNDSRDDPTPRTGTLRMVDPATNDLMNTVVVGSGRYHNPRLTWAKFDVYLTDVRSFAFDLTCTDPVFMHLAGFSFDAHTVDSAGARVAR